MLLAECYGFPAFVLAECDEAGSVVAGLPVLEVRSIRRSRRSVSLPFTDICPPLGESTDRYEKLVASSVRDGAPPLEVRAALEHGVRRASGVIHRLSLDSDPEVLYPRFHKSQVQRNIVRAAKEGVEIRRGLEKRDLTETFYQLHLATRRRQGVPVQPRRFFDLLWTRFLEPGLGFVSLAYAGQRAVAAAVFLHWNETVVYKYGASDAGALKLRPNHLLFWDVIQWACRHGYRTLDFGRTDAENKGLRSFKSGWGAVESPLVYTTFGGSPNERGGGIATEALATIIRSSPPWVCRAAGELLYKYAA
jgi:Acetyltransferase (GNAT) domain